MGPFDTALEILLLFLAIVTAWLFLWWRIAASSDSTDAGSGVRRERNQCEEKEGSRAKSALEATSIKREWEEQGISFLDWLDYSDVRGGLPPESYYKQFESYKPPQPRAKRSGPARVPKPHSLPYRSSRIDYPISSEVVHIPDFHRREFSPLVTRFIKEDMHLYHFTEFTNLESIQKLGLLPKTHVEARSLRVTYLSDELSRSLDDQRGLSDFIHLSFHPDHSMLKAARYRTSGSVVVLAVSLEVLDRQGCCFTRALANSNGAVRIPVAEISDSDFRQLKSGTYESKKWQLLVPNLIPWRLLRVEATHKGLTPLWQ